MPLDLYDRHGAAWAEARTLVLVERGWLDRFCALLPQGGAVLDKATGQNTYFATALRAAGATHVILAGKAPEGVVVDDTCAMGVDALDFLNRTREKLA